jgi:hypothetical protein
MKLTLKQGDTRHAIRAVLKTVNGVAIDLTGATVRFKMAERTGVVLVDRETVTGANGTVEFVFNAGETDTIGKHYAEFLVTYADGRVETFPNKGKIEINVESRIGGI